MYWRIKTIDPQQIARQWALPVALAVSLFINVFLIATRPNPAKNISSEQRTDFESFADGVTRHLLDSSYISYEDNTKKLLGGELGTEVIKRMQSTGQLPKDNRDMMVQLEGLKSQRQIAAVHIKEISTGEPDANQLVPIDVKGEVAIHSADESGPAGPVPFHFRYLIGINAQTEKPVVADVKEK